MSKSWQQICQVIRSYITQLLVCYVDFTRTLPFFLLRYASIYYSCTVLPVYKAYMEIERLYFKKNERRFKDFITMMGGPGQRHGASLGKNQTHHQAPPKIGSDRN